MEEKSRQILNEFSWLYEPGGCLAPVLTYMEEKERLLRLARSRANRAWVTVIRGKKGCGKKLLMKHLAYEMHCSVLFVDCQGFFQWYAQYGEEMLILLGQKIQEEHSLLCLVWQTAALDREYLWDRVILSLSGGQIPFYITCETPILLPDQAGCVQVELELKSPGIVERTVLWNYFLQGISWHGFPEADAPVLAGRYHLNAGEISQVTATADLLRESYGRQFLTDQDIREAVKIHRKESLGNFAHEIPCVFTWDDLTVEKELEMRLRELCGQMAFRKVVGEQWEFYKKRPYGNGICALFYGPPGTGKTMAAQVIANELELDLFRVDLSRMSSKYIGETQKNISELFDRAGEMDGVLLFDEADAFFSRRTQVKDANDRHANGEIAHLLQRLEEYEGITILATNLKNNMDDAFKRRIKRMLYFKLPDYPARKALWEKAFPAAAPVERDLSLDLWARKFELSGSEIKEAAMDAAFLAAAEGAAIGNRHVQKAVRICFEKYGRVLAEGDFM